MPPRRPEFDFFSASFRPVLGAQRRSEPGEKQAERKEQHFNGLHNGTSPRPKYIVHKVGETIPELAQILNRDSRLISG
jgi:hypothetical protein